MKSFIFFILGTTIGAVGSALITKYICDAKTEAKITEVSAEARNFYKDKYEKDTQALNTKTVENNYKDTAKQYISDDRIFGNRYDIMRSNSTTTNTVKRDSTIKYVYLIDPAEAGMSGDYTQFALDYYQDGNLVDEDGNVIDNPFSVAGEYLDDLSLENPEIHIRNDATKAEYDICYIAASYEQPGGIYD